MPKKPLPEGEKQEQVTARFKPGVIQRLTDIARAEEVSVARVISWAVADYLRNRQGE